VLDQIIQSCSYLLEHYPNAKHVKNYLDHRLSESSQLPWGFGYFPPSREMSSLLDLVSQDTLLQSKLLRINTMEDAQGPSHDVWNYFEDYPLVMPYRNFYGHVVALVGRSLLSEAELKVKKIPKYKNTIETPDFKKGNLLFGLYENKRAILEKGCVYVVEGQFDVIKAGQIGFDNVIALGTSNMTLWQYSAILRYTDNIILLLDNDEAGYRGRERIIGKYGQFANIRNFYVPEEFKDIDQYITEANISDMTEMTFVAERC